MCIKSDEVAEGDHKLDRRAGLYFRWWLTSVLAWILADRHTDAQTLPPSPHKPLNTNNSRVWEVFRQLSFFLRATFPVSTYCDFTFPSNHCVSRGVLWLSERRTYTHTHTHTPFSLVPGHAQTQCAFSRVTPISRTPTATPRKASKESVVRWTTFYETRNTHTQTHAHWNHLHRPHFSIWTSCLLFLVLMRLWLLF